MRISQVEGILLFSLVQQCIQIVAQKRPNFVLFMADDLGIGDIGAFGNDTIRTPNIDRIMQNGIKLNHHVATAALCTPSRAAFLTGRYSRRFGLGSLPSPRVIKFVASPIGLHPKEVTFAEVLRDSGYRTSIIGKWHLGLSQYNLGDYTYHPLVRGFDHFYGIVWTLVRDFGDPGVPSRPMEYPKFYFRCAVIFLAFLVLQYFCARFISRNSLFVFFVVPALLLCSYLWFQFSHFKFVNSILMRNFDTLERPLYLNNLTERFTQEAIEFISDARRSDSPFLVFLSYQHVHTHIEVGPQFLGKSRHGIYGDCVEEMDWSVGKITSFLEKHGLLDDTFVYFTSDHGPDVEEYARDGQRFGGSSGIFRGSKAQDQMEGGTRVPAGIQWPNGAFKLSSVNIPTSMMDIFPTIISAAGVDSIDSLPKIDGVNLLPYLRTETSVIPHEFLFHYCANTLAAVTYTEEETSKQTILNLSHVVWKVHFTRNTKWQPGTTNCGRRAMCSCQQDEVLQEPHIFNLNIDPTELHSIKNDSVEFQRVLSAVVPAADVNRVETKPSHEYTYLQSIWHPTLQPMCGRFPFYVCREYG